MNSSKSILPMSGSSGSYRSHKTKPKDASEESILESVFGVALIFVGCLLLWAILIGLSPTSAEAAEKSPKSNQITSGPQDQLGRLWGFWFREKEYKGYGDYAELPKKVRDFVKLEAA
jgi:hypothetical protein